MKKTATILAAFAMSVAAASAGIAPAPTGKGMPPPPPPPMDPCAGPISYNNIELLYANTDWGSGGGDSSDGGILRIEYSPMQNFYLAAGAEYMDVDFADLWFFNIGLGGHFPLTDWLDIAGDAGWLYVRAEYDGIDSSVGDDSDSESGWYARPHLRAKWGCFTAKAGALYRDLDNDSSSNDDSGDWSYFIQLYYQLNSSWDITAGYMDGDDDFEQWMAGVRWRY